MSRRDKVVSYLVERYQIKQSDRISGWGESAEDALKQRFRKFIGYRAIDSLISHPVLTVLYVCSQAVFKMLTASNHRKCGETEIIAPHRSSVEETFARAHCAVYRRTASWLL